MNIRLLLFILLLSVYSCSTVEQVQTYNYKNMDMNAVSDTLSDSVFIRILHPYKIQIEQLMSQKLAVSEVAMKSFRPESPLSNFVSDLVLEVMTDYCREQKLQFTPDFSIINHGGLRSALPLGDILVGHIFELMPFENELSLVHITGKQVIELIHYIASRGGEGVSGITFGIINDHAENIKVNGMMIDEQKSYWIATSDYVANGGDGMKVLTWADQRIDSGIKIREAIIEYLKRQTAMGKTITATTDGRVYHVE